MTRLASILGVATVATLVLLSGCEQAVKTDYATKLEGIWTVDTTATVRNPFASGPTDPMTIPNVPTRVSVDIGGEGVNKGSFEITVASTIPAPPAPAAMSVTTSGSGSFTITAKERV